MSTIQDSIRDYRNKVINELYGYEHARLGHLFKTQLTVEDANTAPKKPPISLSNNEKFEILYNDFNNRAIDSEAAKAQVRSFLGPLVLDNKAYRDLVNSNQLPGQNHFQDEYNLLNERCLRDRRNNICAVDNVPNLLIDNLDQPDSEADERINAMFQKLSRDVNLAFLTGPSGCGKTRTAFEYLSRHFGLFITATTGSNGGSRDLEIAIQSYPNGPTQSFRLMLEFLNIIIVRCMVLEVLREIQNEANEAPLKPWHWLVIQEMPNNVFQIDIFARLASEIKCKEVVDLALQPGKFIKAPETLFPIFLDESQVLLKSHDYFRCTSLENARAILFSKQKVDLNFLNSDKPILNLVMFAAQLLLSPQSSDAKFLLILSGTGLQVNEAEVSTGSSILKSFRDRVYITLGSFSQFEPFRAYIKRYTDKLDDRLPQLHRVLRGRYRFTASFLARFLQTGDADDSLSLIRQRITTEIEKILASHLKTEKTNVFEEYLMKYPFVLQLMLQYYLFDSFGQIPFARVHEKEVIHIQHGLTLISAESDQQVQIYYTVKEVVARIKISEPLVFELLHKACEQPGTGLFYVNDFYIMKWDATYDCANCYSPQANGFLSKPLAVFKFLNLFERGLFTKLAHLRPKKRRVDEPIREPFALNCQLSETDYSIERFISQDFVNRNHKYIGIFPGVSGSVGVGLKKPDFMLVAENVEIEKPTLVIVEVKDTKDCENSHIDSLRTISKSWKIYQDFEIVYVLIQVRGYSNVPENVHLFTYQDLHDLWKSVSRPPLKSE